MRESLPPYNIESEEAVLGSILIDPDCIFILKLGSEDFFSEQNQLVFGAMLNLDKRKIPCNQITVAEELVRLGKLDEAGGAAYLSHLVAYCPSSVLVESYAKVVKDCSVNRRWISAASQIENIGYKNLDPKESIDQIQHIVQGIASSIEDNSILTPTDIANNAMTKYASLEQGIGHSVLTGIQQLDYETGGAFKGELWILGARASLGKTTLLLQMAENMSRFGNVLVASIEMNSDSITDRRIATMLGVHPRSLRIGGYSDEFFKIITHAVPKLAEQNIFFFGKDVREGMAGITTDTLFRVANKIKMKYGLSAIVVDYLGLFADHARSLYERVSLISGNLKRIAESLEVPIISASQLSRAQEHEKNRRPNLSTLRDSGSLEQDADVVLFLYREDYYRDLIQEHPELKGQAELIIAKQRQGEANIVIPLTWNTDRRIYE